MTVAVLAVAKRENGWRYVSSWGCMGAGVGATPSSAVLATVQFSSRSQPTQRGQGIQSVGRCQRAFF